MQRLQSCLTPGCECAGGRVANVMPPELSSSRLRVRGGRSGECDASRAVLLPIAKLRSKSTEANIRSPALRGEILVAEFQFSNL